MKIEVRDVLTHRPRVYGSGDELPTGLYYDADGEIFLAGRASGFTVLFRVFERSFLVAPIDADYAIGPLTAEPAGFSVTFTQE